MVSAVCRNVSHAVAQRLLACCQPGLRVESNLRGLLLSGDWRLFRPGLQEHPEKASICKAKFMCIPRCCASACRPAFTG